MGIFKTIDENCKSVELRSLAEKAKGTLLHAQAESTKSKYFTSCVTVSKDFFLFFCATSNTNSYRVHKEKVTFLLALIHIT